MVDKKRNLVLLGHAQCGKTSLSESILSACLATTRKGSITEGNTVSDYGQDEIAHKFSINSSLLNCKYKDYSLQIVDTPGYADFFGEVVSAVPAVDAAVLVVDAVSSVEVGTETAWGLLEKFNLARLVFINKVDKENASVTKVLEDLNSAFGKTFVLLDNLSSSTLIESVAETDDALLEKYLNTGSVEQGELIKALRKAVISGNLILVVAGSALQDKGIKELLEAIVGFLPDRSERPAVKGLNKNKEEKEVVLSEDAHLSGFVFKSIIDPFVGQLSIIRIFSGKLLPNSSFYNLNRSSSERIGAIYFLQGKGERSVDSASCGDIVAIAKLKDTATNDSIADNDQGLIFKAIEFPEPIISASLKPKSRADEEKISAALHKLTGEDHTLKISRDLETKEEIISGLGDLHLEIMVARLKNRFHVEVELGKPKIPYKETIKRVSKVQGKYKKQSGGRGQYGDVWLEVQPLATGGFEFVDKIFGGAIQKNYVPSVEKGVLQAMAQGVIAGYPVENIKVILVDGSYHPVDSSDMAFQIAGRMAFQKAIHEAAPVLMEPVMDVEICIPEDFLGQISGDVNSRRGKVMGMDSKGKLQIVKAQVPLAEMFKYANDLRSMTGGRGSFNMKFSHYEEVPSRIASTIITQHQQTQKQEET